MAMRGECNICNGLFGPPVTGGMLAHKLCAWLRPEDIAALAPYFRGNLTSVQVGNE